MSFENILGNDKIKDTLSNTIKENRISHSYLFVGVDGIGKKLFAKEFAKKLLCENQEDDESCSSCIKLNSNNHPDFKEIKPDEKGSIKIDVIRQMQEEISEKPIISKRKVYIIEDSETMTQEAQNCLLKTLEEPPEYIVIILITSNESKLLTTVKSRCLKLPFNGISKEDINKYLKENYEDIIDENLIEMSEGSIGKALKLQEDKEIYQEISKLLNEIDLKDLSYLFNNSEVLYKQREKINDILDYINIYLFKSKDKDKLSLIKYVEETKKRLNSNSNYDMSIDYLLMKLSR